MIVRDPVHGDIEVAPLVASLLDLPALQRLRGIKQLGTAYLVYPGCLHTRFDHSLGAAHIAGRIVAALRRDGTVVSADLEALISAAALLHDVTHVPFGHTLEDERRLFPRHDKGSRLERLFAGELGRALERLGVLGSMRALLAPKSDKGVNQAGLPAFARDIVSSTIDADLLDYLARDAHFAGLGLRYDERVLRSFGVEDGRLVLRLARHGMERPDARSEVIALLRMRYVLTERVYYHHTKVIAGAMISKAVEIALDSSALVESDLLEVDDWTLLDRLRRMSNQSGARLAERVLRRELLKRAWVVSAQSTTEAERRELVARYHDDRATRAAVEDGLARAAGLDLGQVVLHCPELTLMKEARARVIGADGPGRLNDADAEGLGEIRALEERYQRLWRLHVFAPAEAIARVGAAADAFFGHANEHRLPRE